MYVSNSVMLVLQAAALQASPISADEPVAVESAANASDTVDVIEHVKAAAEAADNQEPAQEAKSFVIPKGYKILITVEGQVGSKISKAKQFFPIKLARAVEIDGIEVLPAGITGEGQVVHAKKGGFAGSAGELILAARYLEHDGRKIPLRSFKWIEEDDEFLHRGQDNTVGAMAAGAVLGPLGFLVSGGNTTIEPGTLATAKLRAEELIGGPAETIVEVRQAPVLISDENNGK